VVINWRDPWHTLAGGSERYAWECALALRDAGASVEFWTARQEHQSSAELVDGIEVRRRGGVFGFYPGVWRRLLRQRYLSSRPLDLVVDAENGIPVFSPLLVSRKSQVLLVMHHVHQEQFRTYFDPPLAQVGRLLERRAMPVVYRRVRTLAVSDSTVVEMRRQLGWRRPVEVVPNGTDAPPSSTPGVPADTRDRLVVLGRLAVHKRIDVVLAALSRLLPERPGLQLDVIGQGPELGHLVEVRERLGLTDHVRLHGYLPEAEKDGLLRRARLHVCASDAEGWGQVVLEAAGHGLPTVARDVPGLRDSIRDGVTGWLVADAFHDEERLVRGIEQGIRAALALLDVDAQRAQVARDCRSWAERFTWPAMRDAVVRVAVEELSRGLPDG
jgi:glycosyltransferase involved in cell wall biosynthesis